MLYNIFRPILVLLFKIFFRLKVSGVENIPRKGGFILASNHASYLDPIALGVACTRNLNFMARHDLFDNPLFSLLISNVGAFPVKRQSADLAGIKEALRRLKKGKALVLFPEGRRREIGKPLDEPQAGIGFLVQKASVAVVPAFIKGTEAVLPRGSKFFHLARISVCFGRQIKPQPGEQYSATAIKVMEEIMHLAC